MVTGKMAADGSTAVVDMARDGCCSLLEKKKGDREYFGHEKWLV